MKHAALGTAAVFTIAAVLFAALTMSVTPSAYGQQISPLALPNDSKVATSDISSQKDWTQCAGGTSYLPESRGVDVGVPFGFDFMSFLVEPGGCQFDLTVSVTPTNHLWQYDFYIGGLTGSDRVPCEETLPAYVWNCSHWFANGEHPSGGFFITNAAGVFTVTINSPTNNVHDSVIVNVTEKRKRVMLPYVSAGSTATK